MRAHARGRHPPRERRLHRAQQTAAPWRRAMFWWPPTATSTRLCPGCAAGSCRSTATWWRPSRWPPDAASSASSPRSRTVIEFHHNIFFLRRSPTASACRSAATPAAPCRTRRGMATRLHAAPPAHRPRPRGRPPLARLTGKCAGTFDLYPPYRRARRHPFRARLLLRRRAHGQLDGPEGGAQDHGACRTPARPSILLPHTLPLYTGNPWFVPLVMKFYDWQDRRSL